MKIQNGDLHKTKGLRKFNHNIVYPQVYFCLSLFSAESSPSGIAEPTPLVVNVGEIKRLLKGSKYHIHPSLPT